MGKYEEDCYQTITVRTHVGRYVIGGPQGINISMSHRPSWWHRFWMRVTLGIEWIEGE
jgi:hypothetical protein